MTPGGTRIGPVTPAADLVVDPTGSDLHLRQGSPAVDYCDDSVFAPSTLDFDGQTRGFDHPGVSENFGLYDLGADERYQSADPIFADAFEFDG